MSDHVSVIRLFSTTSATSTLMKPNLFLPSGFLPVIARTFQPNGCGSSLEVIYKQFQLQTHMSCHSSDSVQGALCMPSGIYMTHVLLITKQGAVDALPSSVLRESKLSKRPCLSQTVAVNVEVADTMM